MLEGYPSRSNNSSILFFPLERFLRGLRVVLEERWSFDRVAGLETREEVDPNAVEVSGVEDSAWTWRGLIVFLVFFAFFACSSRFGGFNCLNSR